MTERQGKKRHTETKKRGKDIQKGREAARHRDREIGKQR